MNENSTVEGPSDRRRFVRKLVSLAALGAITARALGEMNLPKVGAVTGNFQYGSDVGTNDAGVDFTGLQSSNASYTLYVLNTSATGDAVKGNATPASSPSSGWGVHGTNQSGGSGGGVFGESNSSTGFGVYGYNSNGTGVKGWTTGSGVSAVGVLGVAPTNTGIPLVAKDNSGTQSGYLQQWQDSIGNMMSGMDASGYLTVGHPSLSTTTDGGILIQGTGNSSGYSDLGLRIKNMTTGGNEWYIDSTGSDGVNTSIYGAGKLAIVNGLGSTPNMTLTPDRKVGIGTNDPLGMLHAKASSASTQPMIAQGAVSQTANLQEWQRSSGDVLCAVNPSGYLTVGHSSLSTTTDGGILIQGTGNSSGYSDLGLHIKNNYTGGSEWYLDSTGNASGYGGGKLVFVAPPSAGTPVMTLTPSSAGGCVGIGTTSPTDLLHGYSTSDAVIRLVGDGTGSAFSFEEYYAGVGGPGLYIKSARGSFTSPANLQVGDRLGQVIFAGYAGGGFRNVAGIEAWADAGTVSSTSLPTYLAFKTTPNGSIARAERVRIDENGHVGIGTTSPSHLIQLSGGAYSDGSTWNPSSSVRWKDNIEPLADGVDTLKQLHPVAYNRKETPSKRTMGFIAEEVGKVLPTIVDWDKAEPGYAEGYDHLAILALSVQAVKELVTRSTEQQSTIEAMKKQQELFKNEYEKLHERIANLERTVKQFAAS